MFERREKEQAVHTFGDMGQREDKRPQEKRKKKKKKTRDGEFNKKTL